MLGIKSIISLKIKENRSEISNLNCFCDLEEALQMETWLTFKLREH